MKAIQISQFGGIEVLEVREAADPKVGKDQILVEVYAASINPADYKFRSGAFGPPPVEFPITLGGDFAGVVSESGDEVYGSALILNGGSGAFAQKAAVNIKNCVLKPKTLDFIHSSALPLVGTSAIQALEDHINLKQGQKILIHGGAGGIGHVAIQLAKAIGAYVATTVNSKDIDFVKSMGVDEVIDYTSQDFSEILKEYDGVFDTVGGEVTDKSFKVLKRGGIIVSMLGQPNEELAKQIRAVAIGQSTQTNSKNLSRLAELVDQGVIKPQVIKVFPLDETRQAFEYVESGHSKGKVAINIKD